MTSTQIINTIKQHVATFKCNTCGKTFEKEHGLMTHTHIMHRKKSKKQMFVCKQCEASFDTERGMKIHIAQTHKKIKTKKAVTASAICFCPRCGFNLEMFNKMMGMINNLEGSEAHG
jgi:rubredoxin